MTQFDPSVPGPSGARPGSWLLLPGLLLVVVALSSGCDRANGNAPSDAAETNPAIPVEISLPRRAEMVALYTGTAPLETERGAFVLPKVRGEIRAVLADEGDRVKAGQLLARLDGDQLRLEMAQAEAVMRRLDRDYQRNLELQEKGLVSAMAFETLKFELDAARAAYELARLQVSWTEIRAPIAGTITKKTDIVNVGNTVMPAGGVIQNADSAMFTIEDLDSLLLRVSVPERELQRLTAGQEVELTFDALPGQRFSGEVALIGSAVNAATGTFEARIRVLDPAAVLKPGMFARVAIVYERKANALQVPRAALLDGEGPPKVFVVSDGRADERAVELGLGNGSWVEVVSGLADDDQVVVVGQAALRSGTAVRIVPSATTG